MAKHQENVQRQALAAWVESKFAQKRMLVVTLTVRQRIPERWQRSLDRLRSLPRMKRLFKVVVITGGRRRRGPLRTITLTRAIEEQEIQQLMVRIHKHLGGGYRHGRLKLLRGFTFEGDGVGQHKHIHGFIEIPERHTPETFAALVARAWRASLWANERNDFQEADSKLAWAYYATKGGLENLDCKTLHV